MLVQNLNCSCFNINNRTEFSYLCCELITNEQSVFDFNCANHVFRHHLGLLLLEGLGRRLLESLATCPLALLLLVLKHNYRLYKFRIKFIILLSSFPSIFTFSFTIGSYLLSFVAGDG